MKALVTGGTGFVGPRLLRLLNKPTVLTRNPERAAEKIGHLTGDIIGWNPLEGPPPPKSLDGIDLVFHLAGESVAEGRWTTAQKAKIRNSRIQGTKNLVSGILQNKDGPKTLISSSAVGYYGDRGEEELIESSSPGADFLADVRIVVTRTPCYHNAYRHSSWCWRWCIGKNADSISTWCWRPSW